MGMKVIFAGRLGKPPEMQYQANGTAVTNMRVATNDIKGNAAWINVTAWGKTAETCNQYLEKGDQALFTGRMGFDPETGSPKIYTKKDGFAGCSFEVTLIDIEFLSGGNKDGNSKQQGKPKAAPKGPKGPKPAPQKKKGKVPF